MAFRSTRSHSILFLNRVHPPQHGATGRMLHDLARGFAEKGWTVSILASSPGGGRREEAGVRIRDIKTRSDGRGIFGVLWLLIRFTLAGLLAPRHDLVVTMTDPPMLILAGRLIAFVRRSKHIHWCQDMYPDLLPVLSVQVPDFAFRRADRASRAALYSCDRVIAIGRCMARRLTGMGVDPRRIAVIPNWPDPELVSPDSGAEPAIPARRRAAAMGSARPWHMLVRDEAPKFRILYAGTIGRAHPVQTILDAAAILARTHPEIEFVFVGEGDGHARLAAERARLGLSNIRQLPWQPDAALRALMESGDVHLISMKHEAAGLLVPSKLYSALAVARPCILVGPVHCEVAKVIGDYRAGAVIPQGQPALLAQAIVRYRESSAEWFSAHEGAARAGQVFMPEESIAAWISRARDVVDPSGRFAPGASAGSSGGKRDGAASDGPRKVA